jgi:hypothetical protein
MLTLLSTLISFLMSGTPKILEFFQDRSDKKHELELARMQTEREMQMLAAGYAAQAKVEEIKTEQVQLETNAATTQAVIGAQQAEMQALYAHDIAIGQGASQWVTDLRAATRSILTLGFYFLLVLIDIGIFYHGYVNHADFNDMANQLWDEDTRIMFAAIITFHFGGRAFGKGSS